MSNVEIIRYYAGCEFVVSDLIRRVYDEFVAIDYSDEGNLFFYDWIKPEKIAERQQLQNNLWIAVLNNSVVGVIETRGNDHVSLLFVEKLQHGKGIARHLFNKALQQCLERNPSLDTFYVHASPYSVLIYQKLGFEQIDVMQEQFGVLYVPMKMNIFK